MDLSQRTGLLVMALLFGAITQTICQEYLVPVYVRADQYGTDHFKLPQPKTGPAKSSFHLEQLLKLESELLGLSEIILETEKKLHAKNKLKEAKEAQEVTSQEKNKKIIHKNVHTHNYTRENM
jgi:hypothetical protein